MEILSDFPKLNCPFIRQTFKVAPESFKALREKFHLRQPEVYLAVDRVNPGYEWVFADKETFAVEKLDGTNIKIKTEKGCLIALQNRSNVLNPLQVVGGKPFIMEGIFAAAKKGYVKEGGEQAGELIGPKLQGNPYKLDHHLWYPFEQSIGGLRYKSFDEHERNFTNWSSWFKDFLFSRFFQKRAAKAGSEEKIFAEGVIFYNLKRKAEGKIYMAKLRRDMFDWFYPGLEIVGYTSQGCDAPEDQEKFD